MKHARQTIREAVLAKLAIIAGVTFAASRVYKLTSLPAISVYTNVESIDPEGRDSLSASRVFHRYVEVVVEHITNATIGFENEADDYAARVESALSVDLKLNNTATDIVLVSTSIDLEELDEGLSIGVTKLTYRVWYITTAADPENALV